MGAHHDHSHHDHSHHSHSHQNQAGRAFRWSIALNAGLTALQLVIGFGFGSLALIGDALHNLGDVVGLVLSWGADQLSRRPASGRFTYGYGRSTQIAALINGLLIVGAGSVVVVEAIQRLLQPVPLVAGPVVWAAAAGIVINLLSAKLFGHGHEHDLNQRAAVLHLLTDAAVSVAVLISAVAVGLTGWLWLDALTAIGVGAVVIWGAVDLLREAIALNLDAAPRHVDLEQVKATLLALPAIQAVEALHIWSVSTSRTALTAHLVVDPAALEAGDPNQQQLIHEAQDALAAIGIRKSTLQLETTHHHCHEHR